MSYDHKPTQHWDDFQAETNRAVWKQRAAEHRRDGCLECLAGGCISGAVSKDDTP